MPLSDAVYSTVGCLPEPAQILLLQAALGQGPEAATAWERWERENGLDRPDEGSYRLLPLVYRNLSRGLLRPAMEHPERHPPQRLVEEPTAVPPGAAADRGTERGRVPILVLKGAALALSVYPDAGCRPMRDIDILIPSANGRAVFRKLEAAGWRALYWRPRALGESYLRFRHAMDFEAPGGGRIDLHWHAAQPVLP